MVRCGVVRYGIIMVGYGRVGRDQARYSTVGYGQAVNRMAWSGVTRRNVPRYSCSPLCSSSGSGLGPIGEARVEEEKRAN